MIFFLQRLVLFSNKNLLYIFDCIQQKHYLISVFFLLNYFSGNKKAFITLKIPIFWGRGKGGGE